MSKANEVPISSHIFFDEIQAALKTLKKNWNKYHDHLGLADSFKILNRSHDRDTIWRFISRKVIKMEREILTQPLFKSSIWMSAARISSRGERGAGGKVWQLLSVATIYNICKFIDMVMQTCLLPPASSLTKWLYIMYSLKYGWDSLMLSVFNEAKSPTSVWS